MTKLNKKIKTALDESRILVLGSQIVLGFQFRAFFEKSFATMTDQSRYLQLGGLFLLLASIGLLMWPSSYHRLVRGGEDASDIHSFTTSVMNIALLPVVFVFTIDIYLVTSRVWGTFSGIASGVSVGAIALFWYGLGLISRRRHWDADVAKVRKVKEKGEMQPTPISDKVEQVLTEARMVLPGAQALLGFQFATMLMETFQTLPSASQYVHAASLICIGISVILLMTPAAYHRIVERGEDTDHFHTVASALVVGAMVSLPIGICSELYVVLRRLTERQDFAVGTAVLALMFFYSLWFGVTGYKRIRRGSTRNTHD